MDHSVAGEHRVRHCAVPRRRDTPGSDRQRARRVRSALIAPAGLVGDCKPECRVKASIPCAIYCRPERRHPVGVGLYLRFGGAQVISIEIDPVRFRRNGSESGAKLFKDERLVGAVSDHRVGPAASRSRGLPSWATRGSASVDPPSRFSVAAISSLPGASMRVRPRKSDTLLISARRATRKTAGERWKMAANTTSRRPIVHRAERWRCRRRNPPCRWQPFRRRRYRDRLRGW
jgi:hypothetical protein